MCSLAAQLITGDDSVTERRNLNLGGQASQPQGESSCYSNHTKQVLLFDDLPREGQMNVADNVFCFVCVWGEVRGLGNGGEGERLLAQRQVASRVLAQLQEWQGLTGGQRTAKAHPCTEEHVCLNPISAFFTSGLSLRAICVT